MPIKITAYKCCFCSRCFEKRSAASNHERQCNGNPCRHNCKTCIYGVYAMNQPVESLEKNIPPVLQKILESDTEAIKLYEEISDYCGPFCEYHKRPIYEKPYFIDCDTEMTHIRDDEPIDGTCHHYKYKGYAGYKRSEEKP